MRVGKTVFGAILIVAQGAAVGLAMNALSPRPLPWVRVPLRETHKVADSRHVLGASPSRPKGAKPAAVTSASDSQSNVPLPAIPAAAPVAAPKVTDKPEAAASTKPAPANRAQSGEQAKAPTTPPKRFEALFTTLEDAKALFDGKAAIFVDARHKEDYDLEHVPGAVSLFSDDLDRLYDSALGTVPKDRTIVTYCSDPQCETAIKLADALVSRGHTRVFILLEGLPGWKDAGYPTEKGVGK